MANQPDPIQIKEKLFEAVEELDAAIEQFRGRIEDVKGLDPTRVPYHSDALPPVQDAIVATIREVFGPCSPEALRNMSFDIGHRDLSGSDEPSERQRKFAAGIPETIAFLDGFIRRLEEQKLSLAAPKHSESPGNASAAPKLIERPFSEPVGNISGSGGAELNISIADVFRVIEDAIKTSNTIPATEKPSLLQQVRELRENPGVVGIASRTVTELVGKLIAR